MKSPVAKNKKEVRKYFYELCEILDKLNKEKEAKKEPPIFFLKKRSKKMGLSLQYIGRPT